MRDILFILFFGISKACPVIKIPELNSINRNSVDRLGLISKRKEVKEKMHPRKYPFSQIGVLLALAMSMVIMAIPPITALAIEENSQSDYQGYVMDTRGESINKFWRADYAWLDANQELYVALVVIKTGSGWKNQPVENISYNGTDLFSLKPIKNTDYWIKNSLSLLDTKNNTIISKPGDWLIIRLGRQTLSDPMQIGVSFQGGGFNILIDVTITLHTVTYKANGGQGVVTDPTPTYQSGNLVTVMPNSFTKAGNRFTHWNTRADGTGISYNPGDVFTMPDNNMVLYAQWEERVLTITAANQTKVYGETFTFNGTEFTVNGLEPGHSVTGATLTSPGAGAGASVGTYAILPSAATGIGLENYTINYVSGSLSVTKAPLTVRANNASKVYDGVAFTGGSVTYTGFVAGEDENVLGGTLTFTGTSQGAVNVGTYGITPGGLTSGNYTITFQDGSLSITPASLTVRANNASKVYDGVAFTGGSVTYTGFVAGEDENVLGGTLTFTGTSQGAVNVGTYGITPGGLTSGNYTITFQDGSLEISRRPIQVTANNLRKDFGGADPALTYRITQGELVAGDAFTGSLTRETGEDIGTYRILQGTLGLSDNYQLAFLEGTLEIVRVLPKTGTNVYWFYALGLGVVLAGIVLTVKARRQL
jgi:LPXTG-motif cell wall-anchored protein